MLLVVLLLLWQGTIYPNSDILLIVPSARAMGVVRAVLAAAATATSFAVAAGMVVGMGVLADETTTNGTRGGSTLPDGNRRASDAAGSRCGCDGGVADTGFLCGLLAGGLLVGAQGMLAGETCGGTESADLRAVAAAAGTINLCGGVGDAGDGSGAFFALILAGSIAVLVLVLEEAGDAHEAVLAGETAHTAELANHDASAGHGGG